MSINRTIIIAGFGRCGTTMVMNMLDAAGVPTIGNAPDWEDEDAQRMLERDPAAWRKLIDGKAVKVLGAIHLTLPDLTGCDFLWLMRNPREQAKSMLKFTGQPQSRSGIRAFEQSIRRDQPKGIAKLTRAGARLAGTMHFEGFINEPAWSSFALAHTLGMEKETAFEMAYRIRQRQPECLPYLAEAMAG